MIEKMSFFVFATIINLFAFDEITPAESNRIYEFQKLVASNDVGRLSRYFSYPIRRKNPIPDVFSEIEFPQFFSNVIYFYLKKGIAGPNFILSSKKNYLQRISTLQGELWFDCNGRVDYITYFNPYEIEMEKELYRSEKSRLHSLINSFDECEYVCSNSEFIFRIDYQNSYGHRISRWPNTKKMSAPPELILTNGVQEYQGTMGGVMYTFNTKSGQIVIDDRRLGEEIQDIGIFYLERSANGKEIKRLKCSTHKLGIF